MVIYLIIIIMIIIHKLQGFGNMRNFEEKKTFYY